MKLHKPYTFLVFAYFCYLFFPFLCKKGKKIHPKQTKPLKSNRLCKSAFCRQIRNTFSYQSVSCATWWQISRTALRWSGKEILKCKQAIHSLLRAPYLNSWLLAKMYLWYQNQHSRGFPDHSQTCTEKHKLGPPKLVPTGVEGGSAVPAFSSHWEHVLLTPSI